ncbi:MAG: hypothetical protein NC828_05915 [Candidatus Omnitrophica bacterium]|nr:hypothetical protein [Candidatus Omnitrophota bacterium]
MLKKKNIYVIFFTVLIAFLVILSAFFGLIVYLQWRQLNFASNYYEAMERLDTALYGEKIVIDSLQVKLGFRGLPVVEGRIRNKGKRQIISITLKINFLDKANKPVYSCIVYPLELFRPPRFFKKIYFTHFPFLTEGLIQPNSVTLFKCTLWRCPKKIINMMKKNLFSSNEGEWCGKINAEVVRIRLKPI